MSKQIAAISACLRVRGDGDVAMTRAATVLITLELTSSSTQRQSTQP
jgi:hypothetical protein